MMSLNSNISLFSVRVVCQFLRVEYYTHLLLLLIFDFTSVIYFMKLGAVFVADRFSIAMSP